MTSTRYFHKLSRDVDAVRGVVDCLAAAASHIVFVPAVAIEFVLFACVSELYISRPSVSHCESYNTVYGFGKDSFPYAFEYSGSLLLSSIVVLSSDFWVCGV